MRKHFDYESNKHMLIATNGYRLTSGLFFELADKDTASKPVFKLSDWHSVYVEVADPTEYETAMVLLGDWEHWLLLTDNPKFKVELEKWRKEVEVRLRSEAVQELVKQSKGSKGTMAAKWLAEGGFVQRDKRSRKAREEERDIEKEVHSRVGADARRLGLVKGGKE